MEHVRKIRRKTLSTSPCTLIRSFENHQESFSWVFMDFHGRLSIGMSGWSEIEHMGQTISGSRPNPSAQEAICSRARDAQRHLKICATWSNDTNLSQVRTIASTEESLRCIAEKSEKSEKPPLYRSHSESPLSEPPSGAGSPIGAVPSAPAKVREMKEGLPSNVQST